MNSLVGDRVIHVTAGSWHPPPVLSQLASHLYGCIQDMCALAVMNSDVFQSSEHYIHSLLASVCTCVPVTCKRRTPSTIVALMVAQ